MIKEARKLKLEALVMPLLQKGDVYTAGVYHEGMIYLSNIHAAVACYQNTINRKHQHMHFRPELLKSQIHAFVQMLALLLRSHGKKPSKILPRAITYQIAMETRYNQEVILMISLGMSKGMKTNYSKTQVASILSREMEAASRFQKF